MNLFQFIVAIGCLPVVYWLSIVTHELAHIVAACMFKRYPEIVLLGHFWLLGKRRIQFMLGRVYVGFVPGWGGRIYVPAGSKLQNALISVAGPLLNFLVAGFAFALMRTLDWPNDFGKTLILSIFFVNLFLGGYALTQVQGEW